MSNVKENLEVLAIIDELREVSITPMPAVPGAEIAAARADEMETVNPIEVHASIYLGHRGSSING